MALFENMNMPPIPFGGASPSFPTGAPGQTGGGGGNTFAQVMQAVIPALAAAAAFKQGELGTFTDSYLGAQHQQQQAQRQQQQMQLQMSEAQRRAQQDAQEAEDRQLRLEQMAQAQADREERRQLETADRRRESIGRHVTAVRENPISNALVAAFGSEGFTLKVPGVGNVSLAEALGESPDGKVGVLPPPKPVPATPRTPLVTDKAGKRVEDKPGVEVWQGRPREERAPAGDQRARLRHTTETPGDGWVYEVTLDADTGKELHRRKVKKESVDPDMEILKGLGLMGGEAPAAPASKPKVTIKSITPIP